MPNISWSSAIGDSAIEAVNYKKCMKATFEAKVTRDCQKRGTEIWREWTLEKVLDSNGDPTTDEFVDLGMQNYPSCHLLVQSNSRNTRKRSEICSKLTIKTSERLT